MEKSRPITDASSGLERGPRAALRELFESLARPIVADPAGRACGEDEVREWVARNFSNVRVLIEKLVIEGQKAGEVSGRHQPAVLAVSLFNACAGLRVQARIGADEWELASMVDALVAMLD